MTLTICSRAEWGSLNTTFTIENDAKPEVFIHHVAGRTPTSLMDERAHMRELQIFATKPVSQGGKGYSDMDYNWLIGPSGVAYEGRGLFGRSAATLDRNSVSRAVCLMGNCDLREPTRAQLATLPELIVWLASKKSLVASPTIYGHYQNPAHPNATICPGRFMIPHLAEVRAKVVDLLKPPPPEPLPSPVPIPQEGPVVRVQFSGYLNVFSHDGGKFSHLSQELNSAYSTVPLIKINRALPGGQTAFISALADNHLTVADLAVG